MGTSYTNVSFYSAPSEDYPEIDGFTKVNLQYMNAVASIKVGMSIKSESDLVISGSKGYAYIPAPWWKTDYFELRYENPADNKRYFYQVDGKGIRYELVQFASAIREGRDDFYISRDITKAISSIMEDADRRREG